LEANTAEAGVFEVGSDATSMKSVHQKGSEEASSYPSTSASASLLGALQPSFSATSRSVSCSATERSTERSYAARKDANSQTAQSFNFGEIHAVQERFQALLKQRLLSEYENNPPLFPWESEISEYPAEVADSVPTAAMSSLWRTHLSGLSVSGLLPTALIDTLLERCQEIARAPIKQGIRLVRAVEDIFPESADMLEPIANMVLVPAYRSGREAQDAVIREITHAVGGYDSAMPEQQIALSMLAAQEILGALTFSVSAAQPYEQRSWITAAGAIDLTVSYGATHNGCHELKVVAVLPEGGQLRLRDGDVEKLALRSQPGALDVALSTPALGTTYMLEVFLQSEVSGLNFAIHVADVLA